MPGDRPGVPVTAAVLVLSIYAGGLLFAFALGAWLSTRAPSAPDVRRLAAAIERASLGFTWGQYRLVALLTGLVLLCTLLATAWWSPVSPAFSKGEAAFWLGLSLLLGAAASAIAVHFAVRVTSRAAAGVAAACEEGASQGLVLAARAGGGAALAAEALCSLGFLGQILLIAAVKGGNTAHLGADFVRLASGFALGSALGAVVLHRGAAVLRGAATLGAFHPDLAEHDSRNPAAVSRLLGEGVARTVSITTDFLLAASLGHLATALVATRFLAAESFSPELLPWLLLPVVLRAFGLLATCFGTLVVRTTEREAVHTALIRAFGTTFVTLVGGAVAASVWLLGSAAATEAVLVVVAAIVMSWVATLFFRGFVARRSGRARRGARVGFPLHGVAAALEALPIPAGLLALVYLLAVVLLPRETALGSPSAAWFAGLVVASLFAVLPQWVAVALSAATASSASDMLALGAADHHRQLAAQRLTAGHAKSVSAAQTQLTLAGTAAALLGAIALVRVPLQTTASGAPEGALWAVCAPLAACGVFSFVGATLLHLVRAASSASAEVERQLMGFVAEDGTLALPSDFAPSYRACIDTLQQHLRKNLLVPFLFVIGWPLAVALTLRLAFDAGAARAGLCVVGLVASTLGLCAAWAAQAGADAIGGSGEEAPAGFDGHPSLDGAVPPSAFSLETFTGVTLAGASTLLRSCGPLAHVLAKASLATSLVIACFLL